ncbi:MAG: alpha/beta fold hydrolase [Chloroflexi bacterium]|nr:MAG: alpha/beta fold hydrolase [Chloroflexota bacterium]
MSAITIEDDLVHYEVLGRGRPVILIHSWLGSWRYWVPAMQQLSMKYRTYAVDLWGFGDSGRDAKRYDFRSQVRLLNEFMEKLGITKAALIGHGLGASIVVRYALQHADRVPRLMVVSPPLFRMAPASQPLTANPPAVLPAVPPAVPQLPPQSGPQPASQTAPQSSPQGTTPAAANSPAVPAPTPEVQPTGSQPVAPDGVRPAASVQTEAETMPWRSDELKARIRAALDRQTQTPGETDAAKSPAPKSPRDAATPPTDQPVTEIVNAAVALPESLAGVPTMPKLPYVPAPGDVQRPNPLRAHLDVLDRMELLKRHVEAGPDLDKLKVEVEKADSMALTMSVDSFSEVDTLREMEALTMPSVMVYGAKDTFIPPPDAQMLSGLSDGRTIFRAIGLDDVRHFPMLEEKADFTRLLLAFLETPDVQQIDLKQVWVRRGR